MIKKLAVIRNNEESPCPFGLSIPNMCQNAGQLVDKLVPLDTLGDDATKEELKELAAHNNLIMEDAPKQRCKYASEIITSHKAVQCSYGEGVSNQPGGVPLAGSPFYSKVFEGPGLTGLMSFPQGVESDETTQRNLYYGITSLFGAIKNVETIKLANDILKLMTKK